MSRTILRELAVALLVAFLIAVGPLTPNEVLPSIAIGAAVGGAWLAWRLYRLRGRAAIEETGGDAAPLALDAGALRLAGAGAVLVLAYGILFEPTCRWLYAEWTRSVWVNNHGLFMPVIVAYLAWVALREDREQQPTPSPWGFALVGVGLAMAITDSVAQTQYLSLVGFLLTLPGVSLLLLGPRKTHRLLVPLSLTLLMVPIPFTIETHLPLRHATAAGVEPLLRLVGVANLREGTVISTPNDIFVVAEACSGFATVYASLAVALILAVYAKEHWRRAAMLITAPIVALAANIVRVLALVCLKLGFGAWILETPIHEATGVATFVIVLAVLLPMSDFGEAEPRA